MAVLPTGTVTLLLTDIEGSTQLVKQLRDAYGDVLAAHQKLLREVFERYGGHEIDTQGDAFFFAFPRAKDAVAGAIEAQRALAAHAWPKEVQLRVRMGIHTGEPAVGSDRYTGLGVHRAARIMAAGHGRQVLLSQSTYSVLEDEELPGLRLRDLGGHRLKDLDRPEHIYQVDAADLPQEFPPLRALDAPTVQSGLEEASTMAYGVLGPIEVRGNGGPVPLGGTKQRALLALLLLNANRVVSRDRLIDQLWGENPPETVVTSIQVYVSRLRKVLAAEPLVTRPPGYVLEVEPQDVDLFRFERLVAEARQSDPERASKLLDEALSLWRGPALAEFVGEPFAQIEGGRLEDL